MPNVEPFKIAVPEEALADLRDRLARTRWPDEVDGAGWDYGANLAYMRELVDYWLERFDWRAEERWLNELPQFRTTIDGQLVHFVHARGVGPAPLPLVVTHGWPSCFAELSGIVGPLTNPAAHGGDPRDAFDVVIPSLPGFGFSGRPLRRGQQAVDDLWRALMVDILGYGSFVAHGTDVGNRVTSALGRHHGDVVRAIHLGSVDLDWPVPMPSDDELTDEERDYFARVARWEREEGAYEAIQGTTPQTAAYGLNDSPAGLAAWIVEKFRAWSDCDGDIERAFSKDELLTNITIYWVTETINSSMRRYYESRNNPARDPRKPRPRVATPTAIAMFPGEKLLVVPRSWAEREYEVAQWTEMPRGGHFPALEEPELLVDDLRRFFRRFRDV
ncbi:MAG: epoxide hydrolase family protein [Thermoanaerobaculia bacterium]|jgi:pimeloyl-ACP methyl ester carboxylesterase